MSKQWPIQVTNAHTWHKWATMSCSDFNRAARAEADGELGVNAHGCTEEEGGWSNTVLLP